MATSAQTEPGADAPPCPNGGEIRIERNLPSWFPKPATFTYEVRGPDSEDVVDSVSITFDEGESGDKQQVAHTPAAAVGRYKVVQVAGPDGMEPSADTLIDIYPPSCAAVIAYSGGALPARVRVVKTETVGRRVHDNAIGRWTFALTGPDVSILKRTNTKGNNHVLTFSALPPGNYTLCEWFTGWRSNLGKANGYFRPNGDRCVDLVLAGGATKAFRVNNRCPLS
jgi:hypothetical protein